MKKLKKYIKVAIIYGIMLFIGSIILLKETNIFNLIEPSEWLNVIANSITTILTVGVTIYIFESGDKREKKKIEQENIPIVVLGVCNYKDIDISNVVDLEDSEVPISELKNDSNVEMPLINGGTTPIFHVTYSFTIENIEAIKKYYNDLSENPNFESPKLTFSNKIDYGGIETDNFSYTFHDSTKRYYKSFKIARFSRDIPAIMPQKEKPIYLPLYYIVLLYDYVITPKNKDMPIPILKMYITYKDSNMKQINEEFRVDLNRILVKKSLLSYTLIGSKLHIKEPNQ